MKSALCSSPASSSSFLCFLLLFISITFIPVFLISAIEIAACHMLALQAKGVSAVEVPCVVLLIVNVIRARLLLCVYDHLSNLPEGVTILSLTMCFCRRDADYVTQMPDLYVLSSSIQGERSRRAYSSLQTRLS
jgi:hypothetical protein